MRVDLRAATAVSLMALSTISIAANDYQDEYDKKIKASQDVGILGNDLAGDRVNFYTGATSFSATDISLPGNAFGLSLGRSLEVGFDSNLAARPGPDAYTREIMELKLHAFGDWDIDVPHISTTMTQGAGWIVDSTTPAKRCSVVGQVNAQGAAANGAPPTLGTSTHPFEADAYWSGYTLHTTGGDQTLLLASIPNAERPSSGGPFHWTTNQNWWISCLPSIANAGGGEGYLAWAPDGTKYTFNWLSKRNTSSLVDRAEKYPDGYGTLYQYYAFRADYMMLPTRIEDRFGNWISYQWSNDAFAKLLKISSGPTGSAIAEQSITLSYNSAGLVSNATDGTRTWTYEYNAGSLTRVVLPDTTSWRYEFATIGSDSRPKPYCDTQLSSWMPEYYWACFGDGEIPPYHREARVTHPSGAQILFTFDNHFQYSPSSNSSYPLGITSKTISGPGLVPATWKYSFLPSKAEIKAACQASQCPVRILTDQVNPDGSLSRRVFGVLPNVDESVLLAELEGSLVANGGGSPAITISARWGGDVLDDPAVATGTVPVFYKETEYWMAPGTQAAAYTVRVGANPMDSVSFPQVQIYASERRLPVVTRNIVQQGVTFTAETTAFDKFARPIQASRRSTGAAAGSTGRIEATSYFDQTSKWILDQTAKTTDGATGKIIGQTDYDATTAMPVRTYQFGLLQETRTYNADGTLASVKDGRNNVTVLGSWYRGIPRTITYATGKSETATVNALGWILSTTDAVGSVTSYGYDAMGRMSRIIPPSDAPAIIWSETTRSFAQTATAEYGFPVGQWKQVVQTGNGRETTYFDAQWRPLLAVSEDTADPASKSFRETRYDALGRTSFVAYPVDAFTAYGQLTLGLRTQYDALGRSVASVQDSELGPLTTKMEYLAGFQTRVTNPRGYSTTTQYRVLDQPTYDAPSQIDAPESVRTTIVRDGFGKPLQVTRSGPEE
jgi:YD repeat-containing protein